ncbi:hypothetical protein [Marivita geojedonensis]|uniref:hypothetical protein n=1 Tax=Marivita geojedonensis TaxID=1123756 RepID=UPI000D4A003F|nr:hypothetical protein [Marivita geojedonensis]PRY71824.1 hypothetical protein CLV76_1403 [Marivita geojedonensis]
MSLVLDGHWFRIHIHRIETERLWTLEVIDALGRSTAWLDAFETAQDARDAALNALESEGPDAFMRRHIVTEHESASRSAS